MTLTPKIFIATPMYGGQCFGGYASSIIQLCEALSAKRVPYSYKFIFNESLITRARDNLVMSFLDDKAATHLLFIDADIEFSAADILRLVDEDKPIIGGLYPAKGIQWESVRDAAKSGVPAAAIRNYGRRFIFNAKEGDDPTITGDRVREVEHVGTGYMLIKREVFEEMMAYTPKYTNNSSEFAGRETYAFFPTSICPDTNVLLSEDYHFCKQWTLHGGKVYVAEYAQSLHYGTYAFGG